MLVARCGSGNDWPAITTEAVKVIGVPARIKAGVVEARVIVRDPAFEGVTAHVPDVAPAAITTGELATVSLPLELETTAETPPVRAGESRLIVNVAGLPISPTVGPESVAVVTPPCLVPSDRAGSVAA
jgi:hypothetical protein